MFLPVNATLMNGLSGNAGRCIHVQVAHRVGVGIGDPRHLTFSSSHVRCGNIDAGSQESFLGKLDGESAGHAFKFVVRIDFRINAKSGFASSEGYVDAGALVCHEGGQGLDLVGADVERVTNATLARGSMV